MLRSFVIYATICVVERRQTRAETDVTWCNHIGRNVYKTVPTQKKRNIPCFCTLQNVSFAKGARMRICHLCLVHVRQHTFKIVSSSKPILRKTRRLDSCRPQVSPAIITFITIPYCLRSLGFNSTAPTVPSFTFHFKYLHNKMRLPSAPSRLGFTNSRDWAV